MMKISPKKSRVNSPCNGVCQIGGHEQLCIGCFRSMDEITQWRALDDTQRRAVLAKVAQRKAG